MREPGRTGHRDARVNSRLDKRHRVWLREISHREAEGGCMLKGTERPCMKGRRQRRGERGEEKEG